MKAARPDGGWLSVGHAKEASLFGKIAARKRMLEFYSDY